MLHPMPSRPIPWVACLLSLSLLTACGKKEKVVAEENAALKALPVEVITLEATPFVDTVAVNGQIKAFMRANIRAEMAGRIERLPVVKGAAVKRGQTLVRLGAKMASAQVAQAKAQRDLAVATHARNLALAKKKLVTSQQLDMSKAQADIANAGLDLAQAMLDKAVVRAPFAGIVDVVPVTKGEAANPGQPLLELVDVSRVKVLAQIPERDINLLKIGADVNVTVDVYPGRVFAGKVHWIGLTAQKKTRTFPLEIVLENPNAALRPGLLAGLSLTRQNLTAAVVIPRDAVLDDIDSKNVYVVQNGKALRREVVLGATHGPLALVTSGLEVGDKLIVLGHAQAVDGQLVDVQKDTPCCLLQGKANAARGTDAPTNVAGGSQ